MATSRHAELNSFQQSWGGDLGGAFLVTRANKDYPAYIKTPKGMEVNVPDLTDAPAPPVVTSEASSILPTDPYLHSDADVYNEATIGTKYDEECSIQYWYNMRYNLSTEVKNGDPYPAEFSRVILETQHWRSTKLLCALEVRDPRVPTSHDKAIVLPLWAAAITTELGKFRDHNCLVMTPFTGQHLVPMKWIFSIKTDGTYKFRLVGRGDLMIPWIDFNPKEICETIQYPTYLL